jgi:hypothetical protein
MTPRSEQFRQQLQKELGLTVGLKDPLLALWVAQQEFLEETAAEHQKLLSEFEAALGRNQTMWTDQAKGLANQSLNAALRAARDSSAALVEEAAPIWSYTCPKTGAATRTASPYSKSSYSGLPQLGFQGYVRLGSFPGRKGLIISQRSGSPILKNARKEMLQQFQRRPVLLLRLRQPQYHPKKPALGRCHEQIS